MTVLSLNLRKGGSRIKVGPPEWSVLATNAEVKTAEDGKLVFDCPQGGRAFRVLDLFDMEVLPLTKGKRVLVVVHGYHVDNPLDIYMLLAKKLRATYDVIVFFFWAGGAIYMSFLPHFVSKLTPWDVFDRANASGRILGEQLSRLQADQVMVETHSLGGRVGLTAALEGSVDSLMLAAPAVNRDIFEPAGEFEPISRIVSDVLVGCTTSDKVLKVAYPLAIWRSALGYPGGERSFPSNVRVLDCSPDCEGHGGYAYSPSWIKACHEAAYRMNSLKA